MTRKPNKVNKAIGYTADWFNAERGKDSPQKFYSSAIHTKNANLTVLGEKCQDKIGCRVKIILDSQQPRLVISIGKDPQVLASGGHLIFAVQDSHFQFGIEDKSDSTYDEIQRLRHEHPQWFDGSELKRFVRIRSRKSPVQVGAPWLLKDENARNWDKLVTNVAAANIIYLWFKWVPGYDTVNINSWMNVLQSKVQANMQNGEPKGHWWYHQQELPDEDNGRRPDVPWLWKTESNRRIYTPWRAVDPYFYDEDDRKWRLVEATRAERVSQVLAVTKVFDGKRPHPANFEKVCETGTDYHVHVKIGEGEERLPMPSLSEGVHVKFGFHDPKAAHSDQPRDLPENGYIIDVSTTGDFVMEIRNFNTPVDENKKYQIVATVKPNLMPVNEQLEALGRAGQEPVFGDQRGNEKKGFSLRRTIVSLVKSLTHPIRSSISNLTFERCQMFRRNCSRNAFNISLRNFRWTMVNEKPSIDQLSLLLLACTSFKAHQAPARHALQWLLSSHLQH